MKADYSVEEVRDAAGRTIGLVSAMLTAYAERIKVDEGMAPVALVDAGEDGLFVEILYGSDGSPLKVGDKLFTHPPAQAAQVCEPAEGHSIRVLSHDGGFEGEARWEHQENAYVTQDAVRSAAEPVAQGEVRHEEITGMVKGPGLYDGQQEWVRKEDAQPRAVPAELGDAMRKAAAFIASEDGKASLDDFEAWHICKLLLAAAPSSGESA